MKQLKVCILLSHDRGSLQGEINEFLEDIECSRIKDIKFSQSEDSRAIHFTAMIIYEDK